MGQYYTARVMVGVRNDQFEDRELLEHLMDDDKIDCCAPYYDGNSADDAIVGFTYASSNCYSSDEFEWDQDKIDKLKAEFLQLTGIEPKVWISPHGY